MVFDRARATSRRATRKAARLAREPEQAPPTPSSAGSDGPDGSGEDDVRLLLGSALFDPAFYAAAAGCASTPERAARHYLAHARRRGLWPHPLFCPERVAARAKGRVGEADALVAYLRHRLFDVSPHPLFDVAGYLAQAPESAEHPDGPLGHYTARGAGQGLRPNRWYVGRPDEPRGLVDWAAARWTAWDERRRAVPEDRVARTEEGAELLRRHASPSGTEADPSFSVVVLDGHGPEAREVTVRSVHAQLVPAPQVLLVDRDGPDPGRALADALGSATGSWLAFLSAGDTLAPGRLRLLAAEAEAAGAAAAHDALRLLRPAGKPDRFEVAVPPSPSAPVLPRVPDPSRFVVRRATVAGLGGLDTALEGGWLDELVVRLLARHRVVRVEAAGVTRDLARHGGRGADHAWAAAAVNRHGTAWDALATRERRADLVSVVVRADGEARATRTAVDAVLGARAPEGLAVECLVVADGASAVVAQSLDALPEVHRDHPRPGGVRVLHAPLDLGGSLGRNLALSEARGAVVVLLDPAVRVRPGWLDPLVRVLQDPEALTVQPVLLRPSGSVASAGLAFPSSGGMPYPFLRQMPVEDTSRLDEVPFAAVDGAALAVRLTDLAAVRGLDPAFRTPVAETDLCLRLGRSRAGHHVVAPAVPLTLSQEPRTAKVATVLHDHRLFLDRWDAAGPRDDARLWGSRGFRVVRHEPRHLVGEDRRTALTEPVLERVPVTVSEGVPGLRWAIKNPATPGEWGDAWGDTHFARNLATSLRALGQEVVVDRRDDFYRPGGVLDDVVLTLRGRSAFAPSYGQVSLMWVISHPEMVTRAEAASYDRVLAASESWSRRTAERWRLRIDPLLQATDPDLFHPGLAEPDTGHPVLFVGGSRGHRRHMVDDALTAGLPLAVYGSQWEDFLPAGVVHGEFVPNDRLGAVYAAAGVVLNDHWADMRAEGFVSNRLFDAAASGARVVTDDVEGLEGLFGKSVQVVHGPDELGALVRAGDLDRLFGTAEERRVVAERVGREHSFLDRAARLLDTALEERAAQVARR